MRAMHETSGLVSCHIGLVKYVILVTMDSSTSIIDRKSLAKELFIRELTLPRGPKI